MEAYRVFISSIMNPATEDLTAERTAARVAIERFVPITVAWAFEAEPASPKPLLDFYLGAAKTCDLFLLILGKHVTKPVRDEVQVACDYRKPMLVFCRDVASRQADARGLLRTLDLKYDAFMNAVELQEKVRLALGNHLLSLIRGESATTGQLGDRIARLRGFARQRREVSILPTIPACQHNSFSVEEVTETYVRFQKGGFAEVRVPSERITEVLETGTHERPIVQLITARQNWYFRPEKPPLSDPMGIGLGREVPRNPTFSEQTVSLLQAYPLEFAWSNLQNLPGRDVYFDEDGRHLTNGGQILTCTRTFRAMT
jgi:Domain of unknown function (DUF4062)